MADCPKKKIMRYNVSCQDSFENDPRWAKVKELRRLAKHSEANDLIVQIEKSHRPKAKGKVIHQPLWIDRNYGEELDG